MYRNDKILPMEYVFLVMCYTVRFVQVLNFTDSTAKNDSWLVIIAGSVIAVLFILVFTSLVRRFPSRNLLEIFRIAFGKIIGTIISALYIVFFLLTLSLFLSDLSQYYTEFA